MTKDEKIVLGVVVGLAIAVPLGIVIYKEVKESKQTKAITGPSPAAPNPNPPNDGKDHLITPKPAGVPSEADLKNPANIKKALEYVRDCYGIDIARNVEKIFWNETNFKSGQYVNSGSAGMATWSETFPYSWSSLADFWKDNPDYAPIGRITYKIGREDGKEWSYLAFGNAGGYVTLAQILKMRGNDVGRYASTDPNSDTAQWYRDRIASISLRYLT